MSENIFAYVIGLQSWPWQLFRTGQFIYSNFPTFVFKKNLFLSPKYPSIYLSKDLCFSGISPLTTLVGNLSEHLSLAANLSNWQHRRDDLSGNKWRNLSGITKNHFWNYSLFQQLTTFLRIFNKEKQLCGNPSLCFPFQSLQTTSIWDTWDFG